MKKTTSIFIIVLILSVKAFAQPVGSIVAFAGPQSKIPDGWLVCDGKTYDRTDKYSSLFNAIGTTWGGDGVNRFAVPDLRGLFLRGVNETADSAQGDPNKDNRTVSRPDLRNQGNRGNSVGSKQTDEIKNHLHTLNDPGHVHNSRTGRGWASGGDQTYARNDAGYETQTPTTSSTTGITLDATGGSESRPRNAYVYYIIKFK